jgi:hypothetical protein
MARQKRFELGVAGAETILGKVGRKGGETAVSRKEHGTYGTVEAFWSFVV